MTKRRIAVLFDAENNGCDTARAALELLAAQGVTQIKRAIGDFSAANLAAWIDCARENGIELILQPSLGKGKNGADIRLTIEAMDILHQGHVDAIALVTRDRDFAPLALRLRNAGLDVLGFSRNEPSPAFFNACSSFAVVGPPPVAETQPTKIVAEKSRPSVESNVQPATGQTIGKKRMARLRKVVADACRAGPITSAKLRNAIGLAEPELLPLLGGKGKFQKNLCKQGLVKIVGSGSEQRPKAA